MLFYGMSCMVIPPPGYPEQVPPAIGVVFALVAIVLFLGYGGLWVWQFIDARAACRHYNKQMP